MSIFGVTLNHIPLKYRCSIKITNRIGTSTLIYKHIPGWGATLPNEFKANISNSFEKLLMK